MMTDNPYRVSTWPSAEPTRLDPLSTSDCWRHLESGDVARFAVVDARGADIFPINYLVHDGGLYFRSAPGTKIVDLTEHPGVALEIDGIENGERWSVVVRGTAWRLSDDAEIAASGVDTLHTMAPTVKWNYFSIEPRDVTGVHFQAATEEPSTDEPSTDEPGTDEPSTDEPAA